MQTSLLTKYIRSNTPFHGTPYYTTRQHWHHHHIVVNAKSHTANTRHFTHPLTSVPVSKHPILNTHTHQCTSVQTPNTSHTHSPVYQCPNTQYFTHPLTSVPVSKHPILHTPTHQCTSVQYPTLHIHSPVYQCPMSHWTCGPKQPDTDPSRLHCPRSHHNEPPLSCSCHCTTLQL